MRDEKAQWPVIETWAHPDTGEIVVGPRGAGLTARCEADGMEHVASALQGPTVDGLDLWWTWERVAGVLWELRRGIVTVLGGLASRSEAWTAALAYARGEAAGRAEGAREMRERAAAVARERQHYLMEEGRSREGDAYADGYAYGAQEVARDIAALPLDQSVLE